MPRASLHRLPIYYRCLRQAMQDGHKTMSSRDLGRACGMPPTRVRKDLCYINGYRQSTRGYDVRSLAICLERFLGLGDRKEAIVVGAGSLGRALVEYPVFARYGLHIVALFDSHPAHIGQTVGELEIRSLAELANLAQELDIQIGILAVPDDQAQAAVDMMCMCGIRAIWNFCATTLSVPQGVFVKHEDLAAELAELSHYLRRPA